MHRIPVWARASLAVYIAFASITGTAEAAYHLVHSEEAQGLYFVPAVEGLRDHYVTGKMAAPKPKPVPVTRRSPTRLPTGGSLPPAHVIACESKGSYTAENPRSSASGRYQFVDGTWDGYGGYSHASDAPPEVQDAKAREVWAGGAGRGHWRQCL